MAEFKPFALVVGDAILDRRIEGTMSRISPEAPAPVVLQQLVTESPGGAGNVAVNIRSLGGSVFFASRVDVNHPATLRLQDLFRSTYDLATCLCPGPAGSTAVKTRVTVGGQQILRIDEEQKTADTVGPDAILRGLQAQTGEDSPVRLLVASDYDKGCFTETIARYLRDVSTARGWPLFVDAKPAVLRNWAGATLLKVNAKEAIQIAMEDGCLHPGLSAADSAPEIAADHLRKTYGFATVVVTCGAEGVAYWDGTTLGRAAGTPRQVYDVTGAGDVFLAALATSYLQGTTFHESLLRANVAAGLSVQRHGTTVVTHDEWEDAILAQRGWAGKMMGLEAAVAYVQRKRQIGQHVVLANGCFDALHVGHIQTLAFAKQRGGVLIAAYNDDASIKIQKGEDRPLVAEALRGAQLAMLGTVDCVVRFDGDVEALVRKLHPDVLVKGGQYRDSRVPGADYVAARGGLVLFAPMIPRMSTTAVAAANSPG